MSLDHDKTHFIYHDFLKKFYCSDGVTPRKSGYDLMRAVEQWSKHHQSVSVLRCDDDGHSSSSLVLIPHEESTSYMGITVVYIPQNFGNVARFFLYPVELKNFRDALTAAYKAASRKNKTSNKNAIKRTKRRRSR